ncbi:PREDICTED: Holliday junction recognition protein [Chinchilla lanigera]|uniref:Holliday junction recognition protein n=1 Tax=Chinchilla lanigera TaxID=34839 RepID=A0A8C2VUS0_CHILA|nr:PREDICTED: Holliday junction recognition protein [Chinchilla lanigera]
MEAQALESQLPEEDLLLHKLGDSRRRFQRRMQQLIAKYEHPFEDDPVVDMSTLTYETPQGLRIWGGKLVKEINKGPIQDAPRKQGDDLLRPRAQVWETESESSDADEASAQGYPSACAPTPAVPPSPLKDELRRKYLTQVDILLQDSGCFEGPEKGVRKDTPGTLGPPVASPAVPAPGPSGDDATENLRSPVEPASSSTAWGPLPPCPADMAVVPSSDSLSFLGTSGHSCLSSQSLEGDDICNVTISDLYAGMLHSMSRLLSAKPSCIISTKTFIVQNWGSRRRHPRRSRVQMSEPHCRGARHSQRRAKERSPPYPEPRRWGQTLRDCKNLLHVAHHQTGLELEKVFLKENKPQLRKLDPSWKELQVTPRTHSSLPYLDFSTVHLDWENRLRTLKWLISPVKIVSQPPMLQGHAENRYREVEDKFDRLYRECCLSPRKHPRAAGPSDSCALDVYRGGHVRPGSPWGSETRRPRFPFSRAKAKSLSETFEHLGRRSVRVSSCPPRGDSSSSLSKSHPPPSPGSSALTPDLFQGHSSGTIRKGVSPSQAISVPRIEPASCPKSRYDEVKERFDQLHQRCFQTSPQQAKLPARVGVCADKARAGVRCQTGGSFGRLHRDLGLQGFQGLVRSPRGSAAVEAHVSAGTATRDPPVPAKRRRLSDPQVYGLHPSGASLPFAAQAGKEEHMLQNGREK